MPKKKKSKTQLELIQEKLPHIVAALIVILIIIYGLIYSFSNKSHTAEIESTIEGVGDREIVEEVVEQPLRKRINGEIIEDEEQVNLMPVAVVIENSSDSWPQAGLDQADIVYEALVESSITRFVAIYTLDKEILNIGPVRSARPYFVEWVKAYDAPFTHVGGSPEGLRLLKRLYMKDVDEFFHPYFWRSEYRYAPHNVYTSSELLLEMLEDREYVDVEDYLMWTYDLFTDTQIVDSLENEEGESVVNGQLSIVDLIEVRYSNGGQYDVVWKYDEESNEYVRYHKNKKHVMADGSEIRVKNVVVQVNRTSVIDAVGRKNIINFGSGDAFVFNNGNAVEGSWKKASADDRDMYEDENGEPILFEGGKTWVMSIPSASILKY